MLLTDEQLMQESCQGSLPAFELLIQRWNGRMLAYFYRCCNHRQESEYLCQELFYRVYKQRQSFRTDGRFQPWLYRVATNLMIDQVVRKRKKVMQSIDERDGECFNPALVSNEPISRMYASSGEIGERVERALESIPGDLRVVLVMRHYENLTFKEIAEVLQLPESTIKTRVYRALSAMRKALKQAGVFEADCFQTA